MISGNKMIFLLLLLPMITVNNSCDNGEIKPGRTMLLKDKPLPVIKENIEGHWKLHYSLGGFNGKQKVAFPNSFLDFKSNDSVYWFEDGNILAEDSITWIRIKDIWGDSTFLMTFHYTYSDFLAEYLVVWEIKNDTLVLTEDARDAFSYMLTKK